MENKGELLVGDQLGPSIVLAFVTYFPKYLPAAMTEKISPLSGGHKAKPYTTKSGSHRNCRDKISSSEGLLTSLRIGALVYIRSESW